MSFTALSRKPFFLKDGVAGVEALAHTLCFYHVLQEQTPWDGGGLLNAMLISLISLSLSWGPPWALPSQSAQETFYFSVVVTSQMGNDRSVENVQNAFL